MSTPVPALQIRQFLSDDPHDDRTVLASVAPRSAPGSIPHISLRGYEDTVSFYVSSDRDLATIARLRDIVTAFHDAATAWVDAREAEVAG